MKRSLTAVLIAVCLLLSACSSAAPAKEDATAPTEYTVLYPTVSEIDHCVLEPDDRARMTEKDMIAYRALMGAMLDRDDSVTLRPDTADVDFLLDLLRESPYYYFLSDASVSGDTVHFAYAYPASEQNEMLSFIDEQMLRISNNLASPGDNTLDVILKIYLAVTHEMTYDKERTDNKLLGSPLFIYPADEIYKALRDKKSLCYGFAYVMRFALLQRGIDCFCVYGLCTAHGDGHEWIVFRYDGEWFNCDPAWDRANAYLSKLIHFGKTDREREVDTLVPEDFSSYHDASFGPVTCTDTRFQLIRGINKYSYISGHRYSVTDIHNRQYIFDSESFSIIDQ